MFCAGPWRASCVVILTCCLASSLARQTCHAQGTLGFGQLRPFVVGIRPAVGRGAVGGVSIDAQGVLSRATSDGAAELRTARQQALQKQDGSLRLASDCRKISLRGLQRAIFDRRKQDLPLTDTMRYLAGLQQVKYVFVYPEQNDIVLAGSAEGWRIDHTGHIVGLSTSKPVLLLEDLLVAMRTAEGAAKTGITCSIDPTEEGLRRFRNFARAPGLRMSDQTVRGMEQALGPQKITVTGVPSGSHFSRVMVAADFLMKRLAMGLEASPVEGLSSYMQMLQQSRGRPPRNTMPRWWLAPNYEALLRDEQGLAWQLQGAAIRALTEETLIERSGQTTRTGKAHPLAKRWSEDFTKRYEQLAGHYPVFAQLRGCVDLAVVAALLVKEDLPARVGCPLPLLTDSKIMQVAELPVPKVVDSRATFFKKDRNWVISLSGGVEIDSWGLADRSEIAEQLPELRKQNDAKGTQNWWWD